MTWRPRCTEDTSSGTRHVILSPLLSLITHVIVLLNGGANPMTPALSMTHASVPVPVPFPQLSPHVRSYRPIIPSPCTLGQQVIVLLLQLIVLPRLVPLSSLIVRIIASLYAIVSDFPLSHDSFLTRPYLAYLHWL